MSFEINQKENQNGVDDIELNSFHQNSINWSELPPTVLEAIYTYLNRSDRINMSSVCKNWSNEYASPALWKNITYTLFQKTQSKTRPEIKAARKFGCMIKHVEITGFTSNYPFRSATNTAKEQLRLFLEALAESKCKLVSLKFRNMCRLHQFLSNSNFTDLVNFITNFIRTQSTLKTVEFYYSFYKPEDAVKILSAACESNSRSLIKIVLIGFAKDRYEEASVPLSLITIASYLVNLTTIKFDYCQFFEESMNLILDLNDTQICCIRKLKTIDLVCEGSLPAPVNGIQSMAWKRMRKICPQLRINMNLIYQTKIQNDFTFYLVDYIPLQNLAFNLGSNINPNLNIDAFFQQVCSCWGHDFLEYLTIIWMSAVGDISTSLIPFFQISKKLKLLHIHLRHSVVGIEEVFEYLIGERPKSLESFYLYITGVEDEDIRQNLMIRAEAINNVFKMNNLTVKLVYS